MEYKIEKISIPGTISAILFLNNKKIGWVIANEVLSMKECQRDIDILYSKGYKPNKLFVVSNSNLEPEFQNKGFGKKLYKTVFEELINKFGESFIAPNNCTQGPGATSKAAKNVWMSFYKFYPHEGKIIVLGHKSVNESIIKTSINESKNHILYHGSPNKFDDFHQKPWKAFDGKTVLSPLWFTKDENFARINAGHDGWLYKVQVNVTNTFPKSDLMVKKGNYIIPTKKGEKLLQDMVSTGMFGLQEDDWHEAEQILKSINRLDYDVLETGDFISWLKANDYDSFFVRGDGPTNLAVLDSKNVKILSATSAVKDKKMFEIETPSLKLFIEAISAQQKEKIANSAPNEIITVYHGTPKFRLPLLINGFDATQIMSRDYGGPDHKGLFITPDFEVAKNFGGGAIIEIKIPAKFIHGTDYSGNFGRRQEKEKGKEVFDWIKEKFPNSFRPYMSYTMLSSGSEPQGLLIGVVKPSQITKIWILDLGTKQWIEYDRKDYLERQDVYNRRRVLDRYEEDKFVDAEIDLSNPKINLEEFIQAVIKNQGSNQRDLEEQVERFIKMLKFYGEKRGPEEVEEKLAYVKIGGSRLGNLALKNLVKQVMHLVQNEALKKEDKMRKQKLIKEGKVITNHRFKKLAGLITENDSSKLIQQGVALVDKWLSQEGKDKLPKHLEKVLTDAANDGYFFDEDGEFINPEPERWADGIDLLEALWDDILKTAPPELAEALHETDEDVDIMAVPLENAARAIFDDIAIDVVDGYTDSVALSRDPYSYYGVKRSDF